MAIHLSNFFSSKNRKSKMGDFQNLEHLDGVSISTISANLYDHEDEFFGKTKIIRNKLKISINNLEISDNKEINIYYQGCSDKGFCYPVQNLKI